MTTVITTATSGPYFATADTTFDVDFQSAGVDEILVTLNDAPRSDYVFNREDDGTGEIVFTSPVTGTVLITSDPSFQQPTEFNRFGAFYPDQINPPLDRLARTAIALRARLDDLGVEVDDLPTLAEVQNLVATTNMGPAGSVEISGIRWVTPQQFQVSAGLPLELGGNVQDDSPAFTAAISYLNSIALSGYGYGMGTPKLFIPAGKYYLGTTTLDIDHTMVIEGENGADAGGASTVLRWAAGATGFRIQDHNTTGASGTKASAAYRGSGTLIRNLFLQGGYAGVAGEFHGVHLRARATLRDIYITNLQGDGIYANASAGSGGASEGNVNCFEFTRVLISGCRNGVYLVGGDTNAGSGYALDLMSNRAWGLNDESFLGNTWTACHTSGNASGPYRSTNLNACCVFVGCYSESDQSASVFSNRSLVLGGLHAAGVGTAAWINAQGNTVQIPGALSILGALTVGGVVTSTGYTTSSGGEFVAFSGVNSGNFIRTSLDINFGGTHRAGIALGATAGGGIPFGLGSTSIIWNYSGDGFDHWTLDNTGMNLLGVYKVSGNQVVGARGAALPADASDLATAIALVNAIKARIKTTGGHGLVAD